MKIEEIIEKIRPVEDIWIQKARERTAQLVMPARALGRLHEITERLCGIQKTMKLSVNRKAILIMAGDHGVANEGVSAYPQEVTAAMVRTFLRGGAGINAISRHVGAQVWVVDMGIIPELNPDSMDGGNRLMVRKIGPGTGNLAKEPAMTRQDAEKSILAGFQLASDLFKQGIELLGTGDMGIANTTSSAAIGSVITGISPNGMVGRGTGVDDKGFSIKLEAVEKGIRINQPNALDGLDVLAKVGGFEIGGIAGCILAAAFHSRPVVIDGFISTAGALIAYSLCHRVVDYMFGGHCSEETGHRNMLRYMGIEPILDLGMRLGEGSGSGLSMSIIEAAVRVFNEVLTFDEAGVADKE
ncbi:MAG: nicotinate-nucleotide--dimethylbenzimidazole phosphoribosyltransferase [Desulfobacterales bacterium]